MAVHDNFLRYARRIAATLNECCFDPAFTWDAMRRVSDGRYDIQGLYLAVADARPSLISKIPYFVSRLDIGAMAEAVSAIETVVALPAYKEHVLAYATDVATIDSGAKGVFFGYDFHLTEEGPKLIEINTNAGGGLLNALLGTTAQLHYRNLRPAADPRVDAEFVQMFREEWRRQRGNAPLTCVAIVDSLPESQYMYPEFLLFAELLGRNGIHAIIADPMELECNEGALWHRGCRVDLVYNRLTDFALRQSASVALNQAYCEGWVVVTPNPRAHALYADKRNLAVLGDDALLASWATPAETRAVLRACVPNTIVVTEENSAELWARREQLFFKPATGYGGKAAYRGEKITRRVWAEIIGGQYVAQEYVAPSRRRLAVAGETLKADLRAYVYDGHVQLYAARLYSGQTTNFRTPGGGFAAVLVAEDTWSPTKLVEFGNLNWDQAARESRAVSDGEFA